VAPHDPPTLTSDVESGPMEPSAPTTSVRPSATAFPIRTRPHPRVFCGAALLLAAGALLATPVSGQDPVTKIDSIFGFVTPETPGCAVGVSQAGQLIATRASRLR